MVITPERSIMIESFANTAVAKSTYCSWTGTDVFVPFSSGLDYIALR